ncbi:MAG: SapC family protein [Pseudohongiella sp.]|nr:SapC family protein [Pseudohongiella sp.]
MNSWIAISPTEHANCHWQQRINYLFAANMTVAPVLVAELSKVAPLYSLAFVKADQGYQLVVILGLGADRNFYVNNKGQWLCDYIPAAIRGYPFVLAKTSNDDDRILCIDEQMLSTNAGNLRLFDDAGNLTGVAAETFGFLKECDVSRRTTEAACDSLEKAGLIEPWPLQINSVEGGETSAVDGLYRINEAALNALDADAFAALRIHGALLIAYAQLFSVNQLGQLRELALFLSKEAEIHSSAGLSADDSVLNFDLLDN